MANGDVDLRGETPVYNKKLRIIGMCLKTELYVNICIM